MRSLKEIIAEKPSLGWLLFFGTVFLVFLIGMFAASIMERRTEALIVYKPSTDIARWESDSSAWGKFFPKQYETYLKTADMDFKSKYNTNALDDMLKEYPKLVILWAGYPFASDYNQGRGHFYAVEDLYKTLRTGAPSKYDDGPMPSACWSCKSPDVLKMIDKVGDEEFYKGSWASKGADIVATVGCSDCHDPQTMNLRIARPAINDAFKEWGRSISEASHQEKRSLVCAQCHSEYYFKGKDKHLVFPWKDGTTVEEMEGYYDRIGFVDWIHGLSRAPMLKAQHPDWEIFITGIHAKRGLACADCHMPYKSEGGVKFTDHQIVSPLKNIGSTCMVCHRQTEEEFRQTVYERQDKNMQLKLRAEDILARAHIEAKKAWEIGAGEDEMKEILTLIRHSQWRWDYAVASHGASFHAPLEVARILGTAIDKASKARLLLSRVLYKYGFKKDVPMPDISTKEKAQAFIGLDTTKMRSEKDVFLKTIVPSWKTHYYKVTESK